MRRNWLFNIGVAGSVLLLTSCTSPPEHPLQSSNIAGYVAPAGGTSKPGDLTPPPTGAPSASPAAGGTQSPAATPSETPTVAVATPKTTTPKLTRPEYEAMKPPHGSDAASLAKGQKIFMKNCTPCHGPNGDGQGPMGQMLDPKPRNFHTEKFKFGDEPSHIYATVQLGSPGTGMLGWHGKIADDDIWDVVNYVKSLQGK